MQIYSKRNADLFNMNDTQAEVAIRKRTIFGIQNVIAFESSIDYMGDLFVDQNNLVVVMYAYVDFSDPFARLGSALATAVGGLSGRLGFLLVKNNESAKHGSIVCRGVQKKRERKHHGLSFLERTKRHKCIIIDRNKPVSVTVERDVIMKIKSSDFLVSLDLSAISADDKNIVRNFNSRNLLLFSVEGNIQKFGLSPEL